MVNGRPINALGLAGAVVLCASGLDNAAAANLSKGVYGVSVYYVSSKAAGGGTCSFTKGTYLTSEYIYPGPNKSGATARTYINSATAENIILTTYPTTPANGATTWSGNLTATFLPGGTAETGTFSSTINTVDAESYVSTTTFTFPSGTGSCTSVVQQVGILNGK